MPEATPSGKPDGGNLQVRFEEGEGGECLALPTLQYLNVKLSRPFRPHNDIVYYDTGRRPRDNAPLALKEAPEFVSVSRNSSGPGVNREDRATIFHGKPYLRLEAHERQVNANRKAKTGISR